MHGLEVFVQWVEVNDFYRGIFVVIGKIFEVNVVFADCEQIVGEKLPFPQQFFQIVVLETTVEILFLIFKVNET